MERAILRAGAFASHDPFLDATRNYGLKQFPQQIALAETAVAVL
jgi:hypothetical protein